jgi:hypothetical protein
VWKIKLPDAIQKAGYEVTGNGSGRFNAFEKYVNEPSITNPLPAIIE